MIAEFSKNNVRIRLHDPRSCSLFRTLPVWGTNYKGKWRIQGVKVIRCKNAYTGKWINQSLIIPKNVYERNTK